MGVLAIKCWKDTKKNHTQDCGARSLDILHVGSALAMKADKSLTLDVRQAQLADKAGLKTVNLFL